MAIFRTIRYRLPFVISLFALLPSSTYAACGLPYNQTPPDIEDGWIAYPISSNLKYPRHLVLDTEGTILIADRGTGIVALKTKTDKDGCVSEDSRNTLIGDRNLNHGIALSKDGKKLFASSAQEAYVWDYDAATGKVSNKKTVVQGMNGDGHTTRTLFIPDVAPDKLLVSMGSEGNMDMKCLERDGGCAVRIFDIGSIPDSPYEFSKDGEILGWGLRNSVGIGESADGGIWTVENSADNMKRGEFDIHVDNPGEEVNYHGRINDDNNELKGKNYGYPQCFTAWDLEDIPKEQDVLRAATNDPNPGPTDGNFWTLEIGQQFSLQPNRTFNDTTCNKEYIAPRIALESHTAPLDIKFYKPDDCAKSNFGCDFNNTAFITQHGSWNRPDPAGYAVGYIHFTDNGAEPRASVKQSEDAFQAILEPEDEDACPDDCFRPVGIAFDKDGRMFVTSDSTGELVVIERDNGKGKGQSGGGSNSNNGGGDESAAGTVEIGKWFWVPAVVAGVWGGLQGLAGF
ncbi:soluble quino protein glucose dehydrogenase [Ascobolus immersus RN42]|uniref:Soluble quino protein glucose dehydrogenase n=1 Tax=Ascobolus immersus RN42 TaxID=1160509 RepID=A0A3N4HZY9_ASCIM|nr:soluble quino protein glucose dehydrogenase [Ascobolus immersus RN42]